MITIETGVILDVIDCPNCQITFALPHAMNLRRRKDGENFYCPLGHPMSYTPDELDRLRQERDQLVAERQRLQQEVTRRTAWYDQAQAETANERKAHALTARRLAAAKGQVTRIKNRVSQGACPCCNRWFAESRLARHIASKHPDWKDEALP